MAFTTTTKMYVRRQLPFGLFQSNVDQNKKDNKIRRQHQSHLPQQQPQQQQQRMLSQQHPSVHVEQHEQGFSQPSISDGLRSTDRTFMPGGDSPSPQVEFWIDGSVHGGLGVTPHWEITGSWPLGYRPLSDSTEGWSSGIIVIYWQFIKETEAENSSIQKWGDYFVFSGLTKTQSSPTGLILNSNS